MTEPTYLRALIVDDEHAIRRFLRASLAAHGYTVYEAATGEEALQTVVAARPDIVILDLGLPDIDGIEVTKRLREWSATPVIILSVRNDEAEKIHALDAGADDYLTKPFGVGELLARIRVALRKSLPAEEGQQTPSYFLGQIKVDFERRIVFRGQEEVHLTPIEYKLLSVLLKHRGKVVTHRQLLKEVWGPSYVEQNAYVRIFILNLRRKLEDDPTRPQYLLTEPGVGYRLRDD
jgi:two-component system KDP operon response regulator KdpE